MIQTRSMIQLTMETFEVNHLNTWNEEARQRYPNFEMVLLVREGERKECCFYFRPLPTACQVATDRDFPWKPYWTDLDLFWVTCSLSSKSTPTKQAFQHLNQWKIGNWNATTTTAICPQLIS